MAKVQPVILIIMDGWGYAPPWGGNAVELAQTNNINEYWRRYPHTTLKAAEEAVGLPHHEPGNSEVGHLNIGSGRIVKQNLAGITEEIENGKFYTNATLLGAINHARTHNSNLHLIGLVSDGGVHSHINHLIALLELAKKENFTKVYIHMITDGRDTNPMKALNFAEKIDEETKRIGLGRVESIMGRFYAMDRDNRWDRLEKAYNLLTQGIGKSSDSIQKAISESYRENQYDEFILPQKIESQDVKFVPIGDNDSIIFFNFRSDRTRELTWAFVKSNFKSFRRQKYIENLYFASFAYHEEYEEKLNVKVVFKTSAVVDPIAAVIADNRLSQFHIAETEKYAHVTYFFNGGRDQPFAKEERKLIESPKVQTYDLKPEMSADLVLHEVLRQSTPYDFTVVNFANPDMVGHTGNLKATIKACEKVDECVSKIVKKGLEDKKVIIITADHGNAEQMINPNTGEPHTEHTTNPVPFIIVSDMPALQNPLKNQNNAISDITPTILKIMNLPIPKDMSGHSLLE